MQAVAILYEKTLPVKERVWKHQQQERVYSGVQRKKNVR